MKSLSFLQNLKDVLYVKKEVLSHFENITSRSITLCQLDPNSMQNSSKQIIKNITANVLLKSWYYLELVGGGLCPSAGSPFREVNKIEYTSKEEGNYRLSINLQTLCARFHIHFCNMLSEKCSLWWESACLVLVLKTFWNWVSYCKCLSSF